jgi:hypothetical protein
VLPSNPQAPEADSNAEEHGTPGPRSSSS